MMIKPFVFQQFTVQQDKEVFRVGTDGVLIGALCECTKALQVLEIGSGSGIISLMIAQRNLNAKILALDINPKSVILSSNNFYNSPFRNRLKCIEQNFETFSQQNSFDFVVCNPPYFAVNESLNKDLLARQQRTLSFKSLICITAKILSKSGIFSVIIPYSSVNDFLEHSSKEKLYLNRIIHIKGNPEKKIKRAILEFSFSSKDLVEENFIIEEGPRKYSQQYLSVTKNFHVFNRTIKWNYK